MVPKDFSKSGVRQMSGGVVPHDVPASICIDHRHDLFTGPEVGRAAVNDSADVQNLILVVHEPGNDHPRIAGDQLSGIIDLPKDSVYAGGLWVRTSLDPQLQETISARKVEMSPIHRHLERCHATIRTITPDNPEWQTLDPKLRE